MAFSNDGVLELARLLKEDKPATPTLIPQPKPIAGKSSFDELLKSLKKHFGEAITVVKDNGALLAVTVGTQAFESRQDLFSAEALQEWVEGQGYHLVSVMGGDDTGTTKMYFCTNQIMGVE